MAIIASNFKTNHTRKSTHDFINNVNDFLNSNDIKEEVDNIKDKFNDEIDGELLNFIDKKLEFYNKMTEDKVNSLFKTMWFNEIYDDRVRGIGK